MRLIFRRGGTKGKWEEEEDGRGEKEETEEELRMRNNEPRE